MKWIAFGICAATLCSPCASRASEGEFELTLSEGLSWKKVFESGFRPLHERNGRFACEQRDVKLGVLLREGGPTMHLGRGDIRFSLMENHQLVLVMFYGRESRTVEEVRDNSDLFARIFGEHVTWRSDFQLYSNGNVDNRNAGMAAKVGDWSIGYSYSRTLVERISMAWKSDKARRAKRMKEKISPPAGYEEVSLEPPPPAPSETSRKTPVPAPKPAAAAPPISTERDGSKIGVGLLLAVIALLMLVAGLWAYGRKGRGTGEGS